MIKNYAQNDDGDNNSRYDNFDFSLDMQFDTIKVSSFYRDHGVLGCIDNLRHVFLFSINNSLTFLIATMSSLVDYNLHIIVFA